MARSAASRGGGAQKKREGIRSALRQHAPWSQGSRARSAPEKSWYRFSKPAATPPDRYKFDNQLAGRVCGCCLSAQLRRPTPAVRTAPPGGASGRQDGLLVLRSGRRLRPESPDGLVKAYRRLAIARPITACDMALDSLSFALPGTGTPRFWRSLALAPTGAGAHALALALTGVNAPRVGYEPAHLSGTHGSRAVHTRFATMCASLRIYARTQELPLGPGGPCWL